MGTMNFLLPSGLTADTMRELERACVIGGPDNMPWPTRAKVEAGKLVIRRDVEESGCLVAPWSVPSGGQFMSSTATLMERDGSYDFPIEIARGKVNQLRSQANDWRTGGLQMTPELAERIRQVGLAFSKAATAGAAAEAVEQARAALNQGFAAAEELVQAYIDQVFAIRHQRQPKLDSTLGCRLNGLVPEQAASALTGFANTISLPFNWRLHEPAESDYRWETSDALVEWAQARQLPIVGGPLIDFGPQGLPDWLKAWDKDLHSIASFMCDYVETVVRRYHGKIHCWRLTAASNMSTALSLGEDEVLWLTVRLAEAARQIDSGLELIVGIAQPWGDYMAVEERNHSPFIFADTLIRAGLNLAAVELEWVMGLSSPGSYCRDLLESSRQLDLYALLGVPLEVTLGYPSANSADDKADSTIRANSGQWRGGFTPQAQADWAAAFAALVLAKPYVRGATWTHLSDAEPHVFPHCGLLDAKGQAKPALDKLREVREKHLK